LFGWAPEAFWRATPTEVAAVVAAMTPAGGDGVSGTELERLREVLGDG
jgi:hypothetical protein